MNTQGRLFAFGCSMTRYHYPTWADILGKSWHHYENWGRSGGGNAFIFNSLIECDVRNQFGPDDTVMVMWTGVSRIDAYRFDRWYSLHGQFPDSGDHASCPDGYEIQSFALMHAAQRLFGDRCCYLPMTWSWLDAESRAGHIYHDTIADIKKVDFELNQRLYPNLEIKHRISVHYDQVHGSDWPGVDVIMQGNYDGYQPWLIKEFDAFRRKAEEIRNQAEQELDQHPTPVLHLDMVRRHFPNIAISEQTQAWIHEIEQSVRSGSYSGFETNEPQQRL